VQNSSSGTPTDAFSELRSCDPPEPLTDDCAVVESRPDIPWPAGTIVSRRLRNVRPGYCLCPQAWEAEYLDFECDELPWALVLGNPVTWGLQSISSGVRRRETRVRCQTAEGEEIEFFGLPDEDIRVIIPKVARLR